MNADSCNQMRVSEEISKIEKRERYRFDRKQRFNLFRHVLFPIYIIYNI